MIAAKFATDYRINGATSDGASYAVTFRFRNDKVYSTTNARRDASGSFIITVSDDDTYFDGLFGGCDPECESERQQRLRLLATLVAQSAHQGVAAEYDQVRIYHATPATLVVGADGRWQFALKSSDIVDPVMVAPVADYPTWQGLRDRLHASVDAA